ncbi:MAG: 30S ribosomal protein S16 [Phycisphaerales bacterium]|nr:30S ribosomal protein S16 [Phycisphaerales bacterium]
MVRIRMSRLGRKHKPFFRINAIDLRTKRDGKVLENLGWYDPSAVADKQLELKSDRIKFWLSKGAQPSDTCADIFAKHNLIDAAEHAKVRDVRKQRRMAARAGKAEAEAAKADAPKA